MTDPEPQVPEQEEDEAVDRDDLDHGDDDDRRQPESLEDALALVDRQRRMISALRHEASRRRHQVREAREQAEHAQDELNGAPDWRQEAIRAEIRAQAHVAGLRPELAERLVDQDGLDTVATADELRLVIENKLAEASEKFPELRRQNRHPIVTAGARSDMPTGRAMGRSWLRG